MKTNLAECLKDFPLHTDFPTHWRGAKDEIDFFIDRYRNTVEDIEQKVGVSIICKK